MKNNNSLIWGFGLIIFGILICLDIFNIITINIFFSGWWTLFIIIPCFIGLFDGDGIMGNVVGLLIGILLLLGAQEVIDFKIVLKLIFPIILISIGLFIIFKDIIDSDMKGQLKKVRRSGEDYLALFSSQNLNFSNQSFSGCSLNSIFGDIKCNLIDSNISDKSIIDVNAIFGGVTIYVPDDINVKISSSPIFAGVSDKRKRKKCISTTTLYISINSLFGSVDIK